MQFANTTTNYFAFFEFIGMLLLLLIFIIQAITIAKQKEKIESLRLYNESLVKMYDGMRSFKHDFVNFIQALEGYIKCNDIEGIKSMTSAIYDECKSICNLEMLTPEKLDNPAIYNLLTNKYTLACEKQITMNIEVNYNLSELKVSTYHLCRILGILLDNAIEATSACDEKILNVKLIKENGDRLIIIENSFVDSNLNISRIYEKGYTTKTNKEGHGIGLTKVKEIVNHLPNIEMVTSIEDLFKQELRIKNEKMLTFSSKNDAILLK